LVEHLEDEVALHDAQVDAGSPQKEARHLVKGWGKALRGFTNVAPTARPAKKEEAGAFQPMQDLANRLEVSDTIQDLEHDAKDHARDLNAASAFSMSQSVQDAESPSETINRLTKRQLSLGEAHSEARGNDSAKDVLDRLRYRIETSDFPGSIDDSEHGFASLDTTRSTSQRQD
jgi:hypothetical protein